MRSLTLAVIVCVIGTAAGAARAAERPMLVQANPPALPAAIDQGKVLAIGAGMLIGAAAGSLITLRGATLIGAMAGGVIGAWWYGDHADIVTLAPRKP
jgi:uncharacterized protein YcfJ